MSEYGIDDNEMMNEAEMAAEVAETVDAAVDGMDNNEEQVQELTLDDRLFDKVQRAARLLRNRKFALEREAEQDAARIDELKRALKLLELKPQMEQKEMADLLGMRLRELDSILREAEEAGVVSRTKPEEEDMRLVLIEANDGALELADAMGGKRKKLIAQLSEIDAEDIVALMDKLIVPLVEMGLDNNDRGGRGGFGGRGSRGPRGGFGDRGGRDRDSRSGRGGFGDRDRNRGGRGNFGDRDNRGGRGGFGDRDRNGDRNRGDRGGARGGFGDRDRDSRSPRPGRGARGGFGDRRGDRGNRGDFRY